MEFRSVSISAVQVVGNNPDDVLVSALYIDNVRVDWPEEEIVNFIECLPANAVNAVTVDELLPEEIDTFEYP